jgi:hypothetical protein
MPEAASTLEETGSGFDGLLGRGRGSHRRLTSDLSEGLARVVTVTPVLDHSEQSAVFSALGAAFSSLWKGATADPLGHHITLRYYFPDPDGSVVDLTAKGLLAARGNRQALIGLLRLTAGPSSGPLDQGLSCYAVLREGEQGSGAVARQVAWMLAFEWPLIKALLDARP